MPESTLGSRSCPAFAPHLEVLGRKCIESHSEVGNIGAEGRTRVTIAGLFCKGNPIRHKTFKPLSKN
ncbi:hypothetical protein WG66_008167 [Moniliophthora roreri]|nr:hypothetical protein WG66_008167 [Moniliophthora roreri]